MERKSKKFDEKKAEKAKDRGDKITRTKVFDDEKYSVIRDRGDVRHYSARFNSEESTKKKQPNEHKKTEFPAADGNIRKPNFILDSDDSSKKGYRVREKEDTKKEEDRGTLSGVEENQNTKAKELPTTEKLKYNHKMKTIDNAVIQDNSKIVEDKVKRREDAKFEEARKSEKKHLRLPPGNMSFIEKAIEQRKILMQKYTVKLNSNRNVKSKESFGKNDYYEIKNELKPFNRDKSNELSKDRVETPKPKKIKQPGDVQRKPIITTIRQNDHSVYKAVTFIDQKASTPLQIKIPNSIKSNEKTTTKNKTKPTSSKASVINYSKDKPSNNAKDKVKKATKRFKKRPSSLELPRTFQGNLQTEVAKWKPSSITQHTKPYYEAWVDTTLAAITKYQEIDQLKLNNQQVIKTFKKALDKASRPDSPVFLKANDEKYVGKITVNRSKKPFNRK